MSAPAGPRASPRAAKDASVPCVFPGCGAASVRSLSTQEAKKGLPSLPDVPRAHLCREHYRSYKKATKKDRELRRLGW